MLIKKYKVLRLFKKNYLLHFKNIYVQNNVWNEKSILLDMLLVALKSEIMKARIPLKYNN